MVQFRIPLDVVLSAVPVIVFTLLRADHSRYLLPTTPFVALIVGRFLSHLERFPDELRRALFKIPFLLTIVLYGGLAVALAGGVMIYHEIHPIPHRMEILPFALVLGVSVLVLLFFYKKVFHLIGIMALVQMFTLVSISGDLLPFFSRYPMKQFSKVIRKNSLAGKPYKVVAKEDRWKRKWLNRESLEAIWDGGVRQTLPRYLESLVLLKRMDPGFKVDD